jgi:scyllo-inositol 2-dehydrogenase (NADP+)
MSSRSFRVIVAGMGVQGPKRLRAAGPDAVATVDPVKEGVDHRSVEDVPLDRFDAVLACVPDRAKAELLSYLLANGKHVLVEKPVLGGDPSEHARLKDLAAKTGAVCYTAYNHRFEPHFARMKEVLDSGVLGRVYTVRMFYGNGTARLVRDSAWRDTGAGVLPDLGSHLLDTMLFWFGQPDAPYRVRASNRFENKSPDHVVLSCDGAMSVQLEMTLLSWRNHFTCDILAENGSAHIESLCKWGPSGFHLRTRVLPSGRPPQESVVLAQDDPTWDMEYAHFKRLCAAGGPSDFDKNAWIDETLTRLGAEAVAA